MVEPKAAPKPGNFWREKNNEKQMWPCENEF
jgi:triphosphoribosyl-dephospho-CoA synthetase